MLESFEKLIEDAAGEVGLQISDSAGSLNLSHNAERVFSAASVVKLPILCTYFEECNLGNVDPEEVVSIHPDDLASGTGVLRGLPLAAQARLSDLASLMITVSDNSATNMLIERLGMDRINQTCSDLGLASTALQRRMCDFERADAGFDNLMTAADTVRLLEVVLESANAGETWAEEYLKILGAQQFKSKLPYHFPISADFRHKTGERPRYEHDAGVLLHDDRTVVIALFTEGFPTRQSGIEFCQEIGQELALCLAL